MVALGPNILWEVIGTALLPLGMLEAGSPGTDSVEVPIEVAMLIAEDDTAIEEENAS